MTTVSRIALDSTKPVFNTRLDIPISLHGFNTKNYQIGLTDFSTTYSWQNITSVDANNTLKYNNGVADKTITFGDGIYSIKLLNRAILLAMIANGDEYTVGTTATSPIVFTGNESLGIIQMFIYTGFEADFATSVGLGSLLGFSANLTAGTHDGASGVDITNGQGKCFLQCNIVGSSYSNSALGNVIYSFVPDELPYTSIIKEPNKVIYLPINTDQLHDIEIRMIGTDGRPIRNNNEKISMTLHIIVDN